MEDIELKILKICDVMFVGVDCIISDTIINNVQEVETETEPGIYNC